MQEFRRPEFEVTARSSEGPHLVGKHAVATLSASYYSGGGLPDAPVNWTVTRSTVGFTPPNRGDYHFGPEPSSFWSWRSKDKNAPKSETWTSKTNPQGIHRLRIDFDAVEPSYPMSLQLAGHVEDVNRQQWAGNTSMLVHPSNMYAGIKLAKSFIRAGENIEADAVVVDLDGKALPGRHLTVKAARIDWEQKGSEYEERALDVQTCDGDMPQGGAEKIHVSAAVGAFLVGIALSGPVAHHATELLSPLRDLFAAVFFVFFGLVTNPLDMPPVLLPALLLAVVTMATKVATGYLAARRVGIAEPGRWRAGLALTPRGEFSIVIAGLATLSGVEDGLGALATSYVLILAVVGPVLTRYADTLTGLVERRRAATT